jgi:hypothetical protein
MSNYSIELDGPAIERIARAITKGIRDDVLEDIHELIPNEVMGPLQDKIRTSVYERLIAFSACDFDRYMELMDMVETHQAALNLKNYPLHYSERRIELLVALLNGDMERANKAIKDTQ